MELWQKMLIVLYAKKKSQMNMTASYVTDAKSGSTRIVFSLKERKKEKKENIFAPMRITKLVKLPVVLNECDHIRKLLNKNHLGKVPSKAAKC